MPTLETIRKTYDNNPPKPPTNCKGDKMDAVDQIMIEEEHKMEMLLMKCKIGAYLKELGYSKTEIHDKLDLGIIRPVEDEQVG